MKKLILIYLSCIVLALLLPVLISKTGQGLKNNVPKTQHTSKLPEEIKVYFVQEDKVESINFEEYIKGVIPAEMPALFEFEAKKAQAVAARTYAYHKYLKFSKNPTLIPKEHPDGAIVCTNASHCNAYYSESELKQKFGENWFDSYYKEFSNATEQTKSQIIVYKDEPILAVFHSASAGGKTQSSKDVWGGDLPYLVSVKSTGESEKDGFISVVSVPVENFKKVIVTKYPEASFDSDKNKWIGKITKTDAGYVSKIEIGGVEIDATDVRTMFNLKSTYFSYEITEDSFIFTTEGSGHGIGMSQYGANHMAKEGCDYIEILENYYNGAKVIEY